MTSWINRWEKPKDYDEEVAWGYTKGELERLERNHGGPRRPGETQTDYLHRVVDGWGDEY